MIFHEKRSTLADVRRIVERRRYRDFKSKEKKRPVGYSYREVEISDDLSVYFNGSTDSNGNNVRIGGFDVIKQPYKRGGKKFETDGQLYEFYAKNINEVFIIWDKLEDEGKKNPSYVEVWNSTSQKYDYAGDGSDFLDENDIDEDESVVDDEEYVDSDNTPNNFNFLSSKIPDGNVLKIIVYSLWGEEIDSFDLESKSGETYNKIMKRAKKVYLKQNPSARSKISSVGIRF